MKKITILGLRVSTIDPRWATVAIDGWDANGTEVGGAGLVVHRGYLTGRWSVRSFGSDNNFCGAPAAVRKDLKLLCR